MDCISDKTLREYFLSQVTRREREMIEVRLFTSARFRLRLEIIEEELIDDYAFDRLSHEERSMFEGKFLLTPERLSKLRFSQALCLFLKARAGVE